MLSLTHPTKSAITGNLLVVKLSKKQSILSEQVFGLLPRSDYFLIQLRITSLTFQSDRTKVLLFILKSYIQHPANKPQNPPW